MIAKDTIQVNIRLHNDMVKLIDEAVKIRHFSNRQDLLKSAIRDFLRKEVP